MACESESGEGMSVCLSLCWPAAGFCNCPSFLARRTGQDLTLITLITLALITQTMFVGKEMFFGQDRLDFVEAAVQGN